MSCRIEQARDPYLRELLKEFTPDAALKLYIEKCKEVDSEVKSYKGKLLTDKQRWNIIKRIRAFNDRNKTYHKPVIKEVREPGGLKKVIGYKLERIDYYVGNNQGWQSTMPEGSKYDPDTGDVIVEYDIDFGLGDLFEEEQGELLDPRIAKIIVFLNERKRGLFEMMAKDPSNKILYQERIAAIDSQIETIRNSQSYEVIFNTFKNHLEWANRIFKKSSISHNELLTIKRIFDIWDSTHDILFKDDSLQELLSLSKETQAVYHSLVGELNVLRSMWLSTVRNLLRQNSEESLGVDVAKEDVEVFEREDLASSAFLDLSAAESLLLQYADKLLRDSSNDVNREFLEFKKELDDRYTKLKKNKKFKAKGWKLFTDKDKNLITRFSAKYAKSKGIALAALKRHIDSNNFKEGYENFFAWQRMNNLIINTRALIQNEAGYTAQFKKAAAAQKISEEVAQSFLDKAKLKYQEYLNDKNIQTNTLDALVDSDIITRDEANQRLADWERVNDPFSYLEEMEGTKEVSNEFKYAFKYIVEVPKRYRETTTNKPNETGFYNEDFEDLESDPELYEFYEFVVDKLDTFKSYFPDAFTRNQRDNYLAFVREDLLSRLWHGNVFLNTYKYLKESILDLISVKVESLEGREGSVDVVTGEREYRINTSTGTGPIEEKSINLAQILSVYGAMAMNYKHKSKIESSLLLINSLVKQGMSYEKDQYGNIIRKKYKLGSIDFELLVKVFGHLDYTEKMLEYATRARLYGKRTKKGQFSSLFGRSLFIGEGRKEYQEYQKQLDALDIKLRNNEIDEYDYALKKEAIISKMDKLKSTLRVVSAGQGIDTFIKYTFLLGLGFNPNSGSANVIMGMFGNFFEASAGRHFTIGQLITSISRSLLSPFYGGNKKITSLMEQYNATFNINEMTYASADPSKRRISKALSYLSPFVFQQITEHYVQTTAFDSFMQNEKIIIDGKSYSMLDLFTTKGTLKDQFKGSKKVIVVNGIKRKNAQGTWEDVEYSSVEEALDKDYNRIRNKFIDISKSIHGNYDSESAVMMKEGAIGRSLMVFRSWFAETGRAVFGKRMYNSSKGTYVKGSFWSLMTFLKYLTRKGYKFKDLPQEDKDNMKKNLAKMIAIVVISQMALALKALKAADDDDEEGFAMATWLINLLNRVETELMFFYSPVQAEGFLENITPLTKTLKELGQVFDALYKGFVDDDWKIGGSGRNKGRNRVLKETMEVIPIVKQYSNLERLSKEIMEK